jgi:hypothetical protein
MGWDAFLDRNLGGVSPGWLSPGMRTLFGAQNLCDLVVGRVCR